MKRLRTAVVSGIREFQSSIDVSVLMCGESEFYQLDVGTLEDKSPELFQLLEPNRCTAIFQNGFLSEVSPSYLLNKSQYDLLWAQVEEALAPILEGAAKCTTPLAKVLYVHDELILRTAYMSPQKTNSPHGQYIFKILGPLLFGEGNCRGYTRAFKIIMDRLDVPCHSITSKGANHVWNIVQLDGKWYHVDCTADDPLCAGYIDDYPDGASTWVENKEARCDYPGFVSHNYFLRGDDSLLEMDTATKSQLHSFQDWSLQISDFGEGGGDYDGFWLEMDHSKGTGNQNIAVRGKHAFYTTVIGGKCTLWQVDLETMTKRQLTSKTGFSWRGWGPWEGSWFLLSANVALLGDLVLFHHQKSIFAYDLNTEATYTLLTFDRTQLHGDLYAIWMGTNGLQAHISQDCQLRGYLLPPEQLSWIAPENLSFGETPTEMEQNGTLLLPYTFSNEPAIATPYWTSSDESIATVDKNGLVTAHATGTVTITATMSENGLCASRTLTVLAPPDCSATLALQRGWNLLGLPFLPTRQSRQLLEALPCFVFDATLGTWCKGSPTEAGQPFWIFAPSDTEPPLVLDGFQKESGFPPSSTPSGRAGWCFVTSPEPPPKGAMVLFWNGSHFEKEPSSLLQPNRVYWISR
ncbi:MAG: Ig-like domain-containing protein [Victivallales bacterium]|nr:Ig-like domain-containing protein [Victivallales bacterium]